VIYLANPASPAILNAMRSGRIGYIDTPAQGNRRPANVPWCADNGVFGSAYPGDAKCYRWLKKQHSLDTCRFAVAPDAVGNHQRTYRRSDLWLDRVRELGVPVAFVAQDGVTSRSLDWSRFDALFIGGTTEFKLGAQARALAAEAHSKGKWDESIAPNASATQPTSAARRVTERSSPTVLKPTCQKSLAGSSNSTN
jgi:hypothetical protein